VAWLSGVERLVAGRGWRGRWVRSWAALRWGR